MVEMSLDDYNFEDCDGKVYYNYYIEKSEDIFDEPKIGLELMIGPLIIESKEAKKAAKKIADDHGCRISVKTYDLNIGKRGEPEKLVNVYSVKLKNDKNAYEENKRFIENLIKSYNKFKKREKEFNKDTG